MTFSWILSVMLLGITGWLIYRQRQLKAELEQQKRCELDLQRELSAVVGELSEVKTRRKRLLAASTQALIIVEKDYRVSSSNKVARRLFGKFDKKKTTFIEWTRQHQLLDLVDQVLSGKKTPPLYLNFRDKILEAHARSIKTRNEVSAVALSIHDVTELQRLARARRDFVANISHELRTPLTSIQLLLETLQSDGVLNDRATQLDMLDKIAAQIETLNQLGQELMDLSLIESGQMPLKLATYPLHDIGCKQVRRLLPQAERKKIDLHLEVDPDIQVLADERMVGRVMANLIHNAIKFTDKGCVTISAENTDESAALQSNGGGEPWVTVRVSDTGIGLPPDEISRIFERFYKIDRSRNEAGTGMGLAIAKHIVEGHGGRIWAKNNLEAGVSFFFSLPAED